MCSRIILTVGTHYAAPTRFNVQLLDSFIAELRIQIMNARSPSETKAQSLRERQREQTSAAILDAAEELFADKGLANAHMNDIASRVGVAVGTLYNHFKDRDALLAALLENRRAELLARIDAFLDAAVARATSAPTSPASSARWAPSSRSTSASTSSCTAWSGACTRTPIPQTAACAPEMKRELFVRIDKLMRRGIKQKALRPELWPTTTPTY